jgi:hypothetical protein
MTPAAFDQSNAIFRAPDGLEESQCSAVRAYTGTLQGGSCDGVPITITAWHPNPQELAAIAAGAPIFLTFIGGLPPHCVTTSFAEATNIR